MPTLGPDHSLALLKRREAGENKKIKINKQENAHSKRLVASK